MKLCSKCILSDNVFSVKIGSDGVCNYCAANHDADLSQVAEECDKCAEVDLTKYKRKGHYDIVLAYSGGKDSTYTLHLLKEKYGLNILAVTLDNGFLAEDTYKNIRNVCSNLDVDSLIIAPSAKKMHAIFNYANKDECLPKKALERASAICTYCIGIVKMHVYKEAILRDIPLIAFGWTPGQINMSKQIVRLDYKIIKSNFARIKNVIISEFGEAYNSILLSDDLLDRCQDKIPSLFYPFANNNYDEDHIYGVIQGMGWKKPGGIDENSTNCLLNAYAVHTHNEKYGFHPYALELAYLVRNNLLDREEALRRVTKDEDIDIINYIEKKLRE